MFYKEYFYASILFVPICIHYIFITGSYYMKGLKMFMQNEHNLHFLWWKMWNLCMQVVFSKSMTMYILKNLCRISKLICGKINGSFNSIFFRVFLTCSSGINFSENFASHRIKSLLNRQRHGNKYSIYSSGFSIPCLQQHLVEYIVQTLINCYKRDWIII